MDKDLIATCRTFIETGQTGDALHYFDLITKGSELSETQAKKIYNACLQDIETKEDWAKICARINEILRDNETGRTLETDPIDDFIASLPDDDLLDKAIDAFYSGEQWSSYNRETMREGMRRAIEVLQPLQVTQDHVDRSKPAVKELFLSKGVELKPEEINLAASLIVRAALQTKQD